MNREDDNKSIEDIKNKVDSDLAKILAETGDDIGIIPNKDKKITEEIVEQNSDNNDSDYSDFEKSCIEKGWSPEGEKSAKEWDKDYALYAELKRRGKELKKASKRLADYENRLLRIETETYEKAKRELLEAKHYANNDQNKIKEIDNKLAELSSPSQNSLPSEWIEYKEQNEDWLSGQEVEHIEMQLYAKEKDEQLLRLNYSPKMHAEALDKLMKNKFSSYFNEGRNSEFSNDADEEDSYSAPSRATKEKVAAVADDDGGNSIVSTNRNAKRLDTKSLTEEEKDALNYVVKSGLMTKENYLTELQKSRG